MGKAINGDPQIDVDTWNAGVAIQIATSNKVLRNTDLGTLEYVRERCALYLARSEKYIRVRQDQGIKSQLAKLKLRLI